MADLDNRDLYSTIDRSGMREQIRGLAAQCRQAWEKGAGFDLPKDFRHVDKVVILGMGGSAIGGDLLRALASTLARPQVAVNREYDLPSWVDGRTLVIASSYSGNTEETISAFGQALKTNCKCMVISTGGRVSAMAREKGLPVFTIDHVSSPRAALGYSLMPLLAIMQGLGLLKAESADVNDTVNLMEKLSARWQEDVPVKGNYAKSLALKMEGKLAVIYGAGILTDVARRWKTQINENSKAWAFFETLPELNHNAIVGYPYPARLARDIFVVFLRSSLLHERILIRCQVTGELLQKEGIPFEYIDAEGSSPLAHMMGMVLLGDWVSYYLAMLYGVDPTPVPVIDFLKKRLADAK